MSDPTRHRRKFLVVVDDTPECRVALRFAARRAEHTGGIVCLLHVMAPLAMQQSRALEELMREEAEADAESTLHEAASRVHAVSGLISEVISRGGKKKETVLALLKEDRAIAVLVLASSTGREGPGPLVTAAASAAASAFPIPVTIVPGTLTEAEIDALA
jgi:nucleotide-binding universal stress UspA family protein